MTVGSRKTILLVEDEGIIAMTEQMELEEYGYSVLTATTGEEAILAVASSPEIDLILMDIDLGGGIDGTQTAELILEDHDIPILFVSSHGEREVIEKTEKITSYGYVVKNSSITALDASIKMAFKLFYSYQKISASEIKYKYLSDNIPDIIYSLDREGKIETMNSSSFMRYGNNQETPIGKSFIDFVHPEDQKAVLSSFAAVKKEKRVQTIGLTFRFIAENGSVCWLELNSHAHFDSQGSYCGEEGLLRDITDRKKNEDALRASKETAELLLNVAAEIIISEDFEGNILLLNESGHTILGYESPELVGRNYIDTCVPDELKEDIRKYYKERENEGTKSTDAHENEVITKTGERKTILWRNIVFEDKNNAGLCSFSSGQDITERKRAEIALQKKNEELQAMGNGLRESEEKFSKIFQGTHYPLMLIDMENGHLKEVNEAVIRSLGFSREELIGKCAIELGILDSDAALKSRKLIGEFGQFSDLEIPVKTKSGAPRVGMVTGQVIEINRQPYLLQTVVDITERKKTEEQIRLLLAEKELILKEVHHRIKNNMNAIGSLLSLQARTVKEPAATRALEDAKNRVHSTMVLYDKLYLSSSFSNMSVKDHLPALIDEIVGNFPNSHRVKIEKRIQDFILDAKHQQPLGIIINELLTNSMKYAFEGKDSGLITVSAAITDGTVVIGVQDNGIGIPESLTLENSTGFGLTLVKMLAEQLDGTVRIKRENGTKFVLEFRQ